MNSLKIKLHITAPCPKRGNNVKQYEYVLLALMDKEKAGKNTSRAAIFKKLGSR